MIETTHRELLALYTCLENHTVAKIYSLRKLYIYDGGVPLLLSTSMMKKDEATVQSRQHNAMLDTR